MTDKMKDDAWKQYALKKLRQLYKTDEVEAYVFLLTMFENFFPHTHSYRYIQDIPRQKYGIENFQHIKIPTRDQLELDAWYFPVKNPRATILVLHGSGYNMADNSLPRGKFLMNHRCQLLLYNARYWNYAGNPETYVANPGNDIRDIEDIVGWMKKKPAIGKNKLGIFGLSSGGYKAGLAAARIKELEAVILDAPATGIFPHKSGDKQMKTMITAAKNRIKERYGYDLQTEEFNILNRIKEVAPNALLLLHGEKDKIVPIKSTERLYESAAPPKLYRRFPHSGHCEAMLTADKEIYIRTVAEFLETYL